MARFAARTEWDLTPTRLAECLEARRRAGLPVLDLAESNPTRCGLALDPAVVLGALAHPEALQYRPEPLGLPAARDAVAAYYAAMGATVAPDRICLTASTSEAYTFLFRLLANPGDEILVPRPSYPLLDFLSGLNDVRPVPYPLEAARGWGVDVAALRGAAGRRARAIVVVHPNNPTGSYLRPDERDALVALCGDRGLALIVDEVFGDYPLAPPGGRAGTLAGAAGALTFVLSGLSKVLALPQMKLAWITAGGPADEVRETMGRLEVIADTYLSVGTPIQRAAPTLLARRAEVQGRILARLRGNANLLRDRAAAAPHVEAIEPEGGWYAILRLPGLKDEETFAHRLLEERGVHVHPGYLFEFDDPGYLVVSLLPPEDVFAEGIARLLDQVRSLL